MGKCFLHRQLLSSSHIRCTSLSWRGKNEWEINSIIVNTVRWTFLCCVMCVNLGPQNMCTYPTLLDEHEPKLHQYFNHSLIILGLLSLLAFKVIRSCMDRGNCTYLWCFCVKHFSYPYHSAIQVYYMNINNYDINHWTRGFVLFRLLWSHAES